jgi:hypothetical protein
MVRLVTRILERGALLLMACSALASCKKPEATPSPPPSAASVPSAVPVDHLAPGELAPGKSQIFGFDVPVEMKVKARTLDRVTLEGDVAADALVNYVRERVVVTHVEIGAGRTIFPRARIKEGPPDRVYQLEVMPSRRQTLLSIEDVTPAPVENLTQEERWRRAGRGPDGKPIREDELK